MSDYFTRHNTIEVGPGPVNEIEWMVIQKPSENLGITECAVVKARTAYLAWEKAARIIPNFCKQSCYCFPNPTLRFEEKK